MDRTGNSSDMDPEQQANLAQMQPMSSSYADGLSPYEHKGKVGLEEIFDTEEEVQRKIQILASWVKQSKHIVCHTGAGISTAAGIPDFRGPQGVWTLERKGEKPKFNKSFNEVMPTSTHMAIKTLVDHNIVKFVVSQNIDGLHLRSGLGRQHLAELHGNMFTEQCNKCNGLFLRSDATTSVGCKYLNKNCPGKKGRMCRGKIKDTILDWEHNLPEEELNMADWHSNLADLSIAMGTTMQIVPSGNLPTYVKKRGGKLVICNLQPTKHDKKADLIINTYTDRVMDGLLKALELEASSYDPSLDPTKKVVNQSISWDFPKNVLSATKRLHLDLCSKVSKRTKKETENNEPARGGKRVKKEEDDSSLPGVIDQQVKELKEDEGAVVKEEI